MTRLRGAARLSLLLLGTGSCDDERPVPPVTPPAVLLLMECIECSAGELAAVAAMGDAAVPALRRFLLDGPPAESVDRMRRSLVELVGDPAVPPGTTGVVAPAVVSQLDDYIALYRLRAALGLGAVGTASARAALCAARATGLGQAGVGPVLDSALLAAGRGPCP